VSRNDPKPTGGKRDSQLTPMMRQYWSIKHRHPNDLLFYRMGEFYELFFADAERASEALGITLTTRGKHLGEDIPMCGVPIHSSETYVLELIRKGHRVAICEQTEDPEEARRRGSRSVVRREVVRVITPGTLTEDSLLQPGRNNYLAAWSEVRETAALARIDLSTGEFRVAQCPRASLVTMVSRIGPSEILLPDRLCDDRELAARLRDAGVHLTPLGPGSFDSVSAVRRLQKLFRIETLDSYGQFTRAELSVMGALADYVELTQRGAEALLRPPTREQDEDILQIDSATRRNLELTATFDGKSEGCLLAAINRTMTSAGARLLESRIASPSTRIEEIERRQDAVAWLAGAPERTRSIRKLLRGVPDLERAVSRLALDRGSPKDLGALRTGLTVAASLIGELGDGETPAELRDTKAALAGNDEFCATLKAALADSLPPATADGNFVRAGYRDRLDRARALRDEGQAEVHALQERYRQTTGVASLRIRHNQVLGWFVEVRSRVARHLDAAPHGRLFTRRQSVADAERYATDELADLERRITGAGAEAQEIELTVFSELRTLTLASAAAVLGAARAIAALDVAACQAGLAIDDGWVRPEMSEDLRFEIAGGRHPVVEQALRASGGSEFVPNDCDLSAQGESATPLWIVTGPNMAGKSTFLRQNALITVLAQAGAFVPAKRARIGIVDRLFSRVGAADDLARGRSTFMVEMVETAAILNQARERSFVILDEIGRGTATYDGLSIAWAVLEHLRVVNRSRTLFATHYHELTELSEKLPGVRNATVRVQEWEGDLVFLHEVVAGVADRSYGVQVARLAGIPNTVIRRAAELLQTLEDGGGRSLAGREGPASLFDSPPPEYWLRSQGSDMAPLKARLKELDPDAMTPLEAIQAIYELRQLAAAKP